MRLLAIGLVLALLATTNPVTSRAADPAEPPRSVSDSAQLHLQSDAVLDPDLMMARVVEAAQEAAIKQAIERDIAVGLLNLAKAELRKLNQTRPIELARLRGLESECERERIEASYRKEQARLAGVIKEQRRVVGDNRKLLTKVWHRVGPTGRTILRAFVKKALIIYTGGGSLAGGAARELLVDIGRRELKRVIERSIARKVDHFLGRARSDARSQCASAADASPAAVATPRTGFDSGTGVVGITGTYPGPDSPRSLRLSLLWEDFLDPGRECPAFQAYNPSSENLYLPGVDFDLLADLDAGSLSGTISGLAHSAQVGYDAWGTVELDIEGGELKQRAGENTWDLQALAATIVSYGQDGTCRPDVGFDYQKQRVDTTSGVAEVTGEISKYIDGWRLDLRATQVQGTEELRLDVTDIMVTRSE